MFAGDQIAGHVPMSPSAIFGNRSNQLQLVEEFNGMKSNLSQGISLNWVKMILVPGTAWVWTDPYRSMWTPENCWTNDYELYRIKLIAWGKQWWKNRILFALAISFIFFIFLILLLWFFLETDLGNHVQRRESPLYFQKENIYNSRVGAYLRLNYSRAGLQIASAQEF